MLDLDWSTILFQMVNFALVLAVLNHYIYQPTLKLLDDRQNRIEEELHLAAKAKAEGEEAQVHQNQELARLRSQVVDEREKAHREVDQMRQKLAADLEREAQERRADLQLELKKSKALALRQLDAQLGEIVVAALASLLQDLRAPSVSEALFESFLAQLRELSPVAREELQQSSALIVQSAEPMSEPDRQRLGKALGDVLNPVPKMAYQVQHDLIKGIRILSKTMEVDGSLKVRLAEVTQAYQEGTPHGG